MRPVLKPALRRLWRDETTLQLGQDPRHAVVLADVGTTEARLLAALDGTRDRSGVLRAATVLGVPTRAADRLLDVLTDAAALDDGTAGAALAGLPRTERERLTPDLAALSLVHPALGAADRILAARRQAAVRVVGGARLGTPVATLLAAAGVGHVVVADPLACRPGDAAPGGLMSADAGLPRERAAARAIHRAAPAVEQRPAAHRAAPGPHPAGRQPGDPGRADGAAASSAPAPHVEHSRDDGCRRAAGAARLDRVLALPGPVPGRERPRMVPAGRPARRPPRPARRAL